MLILHCFRKASSVSITNPNPLHGVPSWAFHNTKSQFQGLDFRMKLISFSQVNQRTLDHDLSAQSNLAKACDKCSENVTIKTSQPLPTLSATKTLPTNNHSLLPRPSATGLRWQHLDLALQPYITHVFCPEDAHDAEQKLFSTSAKHTSWGSCSRHRLQLCQSLICCCPGAQVWV